MKSGSVSVFDLNKLTRASYILTKINRVAHLLFPNFTQNRKSIYYGLINSQNRSTNLFPYLVKLFF